MKKVIILLGVPGSGKGTQAEKIAQKYDFVHISTGDIFRALKNDLNQTEEAREILSIMSRGGLVSDENVFRLTAEKIKLSLSTKNGVVVDGAVRSVGQAELFYTFFAKEGLLDDLIVIEIKISDETSLTRLIYRKDNSVNLREDDNDEIIKKRVKEQGNIIVQPIVEYYKSKGVYHFVDGEKTIEEVVEQIDEIIKL